MNKRKIIQLKKEIHNQLDAIEKLRTEIMNRKRAKVELKKCLLHLNMVSTHLIIALDFLGE